ncbi:LysR family transcriptional regulator [Campylobacter sp. RM12640]|uniref:LysR family transcriptional regulator n=1 Tax=unclassified Campylobacter TaxID=2593542 RepID=UPI001BDB2101|nr:MULTISPECIES: LysR family transcriptional regulator [unclassified Campylobacter]MBZ7979280.1 LysR family transcriptional regulator [Campylobacter sp. RM12642]MBZ7981287.1 LysR family transcriptional regulator [Campylobacter sp. RM12640]MBZ7989501.1 LysR family transcriptional regulator [Campylobacter sp. RM12635]MBZ8007265.1 LysR family transcriptional regulator [Campylobacter sp. RM9334]MBT0880549.1 LysR family transcriptional regulator [Campylobacter sp. 2018MI27]
MNFRHMQLFLKVAKLQSFTKAANELKIPQPSLSQSIFALENELKTTLFNRSTNPISLTEAGEIYLKKANLIKDMIAELDTEISALNNAKTGKIRIAFLQNGYNMIPNLLPQFCKRFSDADIKISQIFSTLKIKQMIYDDEIDLGMLVLPLDIKYLKYEIIKSSNVFLALPSLHELSLKYKNKELPEISIKELKNEKFILPKSSQRSRLDIDLMFKNNEFIPKILCETETFDIANSIVASGVGATFTISELIKDDKKDKIKLFNIKDNNLIKTLVIAYKKDKKLSHLELEFIKMAKELGA